MGSIPQRSREEYCEKQKLEVADTADKHESQVSVQSSFCFFCLFVSLNVFDKD